LEESCFEYFSKTNLEKEPPFLFEMVAVYKPLLTTNDCVPTDDTGEDRTTAFVSTGALSPGLF
jgi:hypothetical protein